MSQVPKCAAKVIPHPDRFDYGELDGKVANFLRGHADRLRRSIAKSLVQIGRDLLGAKHYLSHGAFVRWVESEVGIPARTAQGYMKIAQWAEGKSANVAHLPPSALYILSAQTTPTEIVDNVLTTVEAGGTVCTSEIRHQLRAFRASQRQAQTRPPAESAYSHPTLVFNGDAPETVPWRELGGGNHYDVIENDDLLEVAEILTRTLSPRDRERIHQIMTNRHLLSANDLAERIRAAFERIALHDAEKRERHEALRG
jgi:hypothetical protein